MSFSKHKKLKKRFGFLCIFEDYLVDHKEAQNQNLLSIEENCDFLARVYSNNLNGNELFNDIKEVIVLLKRAKRNSEKLDLNPKGVSVYISSLGLEAYNKSFVTGLKIFLNLPLSIVSCECSFSKLNLIKSFLRSTMSQPNFGNYFNWERNSIIHRL